MNRSPIRAAAIGVAVGAGVLLLVLWTLGALRETTDPGLPVTPWATLVSFPMDRLLRDVAATVALGFAVVGGLLVPRPDARLARVVSWAALVWLAALLAQVVLTISELLGRSWADSVEPIVVQSLLSQTELGRFLVVQVVLVALVVVLGWAIFNRVTAWIVIAGISVAAFLPALSGHSGLHGGHTAASISLGSHLLALGLWVGGLVAVCVYVARDGEQSALVVRRFSVLALVCVIVLAESGLLNASLRMDGIASLVTSTYGSIILAKATLLLALVILGWRQRSRAVPTIDGPVGRATLVRLAAYEFLLMGIALGLSAALARVAPPAGALIGDKLTLGTYVILGIAVPLVMVWGLRLPRSIGRVTRAYPEAFAVALICACAIGVIIVPSPAPGVAVAAVLGSFLILVCGYLFAAGASGPRGWPAALIVMIAWPCLAWWQLRSPGPDSAWTALACLALAEGCLLLIVLLGRSTAESPVPATIEEPAEVAP